MNSLNKAIEAIKEKAADAVNWLGENPEVIVASTVVLGKTMWEVGRAKKRKQVADIEKEKRLRLYDRSAGYSYRLKRPLSNAEIHEYKTRMCIGEDPYDILRDMGVLKR